MCRRWTQVIAMVEWDAATSEEPNAHQAVTVCQWAGVRFPPPLPSFLFWKSMLPAQLCFIIHFVFSSSNSRVPQEAVTAGFLDEVYWSFRSVSHLCRQDDEAAGYQFCHHCE